MNTRSSQNRRAGFSLVEVTLALGIVGFAVVTVLALLPMGLVSLQASSEQTVESQISQQISADILQTPFPDVGAITRYYDNEGFPVSNASEAIFTAVAELAPIEYPGSEKLTSLPTPLSESLKVLNIQVTTAASAQANPRDRTTFSLFLARRDKL